MADFRQIHCRIWQDNWFSELANDEKLFFIYLFSNHRATIAGMYEIPFRFIPFETGLKEDRIREIFTKFAQQKKVFYDYDTGVLWVVNLRKYNETQSVKVKTRINKDVAMTPDSKVKELYCRHYQIPYKYPISETDTDTETETDTETPSPLSTLALALSTEYQSRTGDTSINPQYIESFESMAAKGIHPEDLRGAINYFKNKDITITSPEKLEKSAAYQRDKRMKEHPDGPLPQLMDENTLLPHEEWERDYAEGKIQL